MTAMGGSGAAGEFRMDGKAAVPQPVPAEGGTRDMGKMWL